MDDNSAKQLTNAETIRKSRRCFPHLIIKISPIAAFEVTIRKNRLSFCFDFDHDCYTDADTDCESDPDTDTDTDTDCDTDPRYRHRYRLLKKTVKRFERSVTTV